MIETGINFKNLKKIQQRKKAKTKSKREGRKSNTREKNETPVTRVFAMFFHHYQNFKGNKR